MVDVSSLGKVCAGAGAVLIAVSIETNGDLKNIMFTSGSLLTAIGTYIAIHFAKKVEKEVKKNNNSEVI